VYKSCQNCTLISAHHALSKPLPTKSYPDFILSCPNFCQKRTHKLAPNRATIFVESSNIINFDSILNGGSTKSRADKGESHIRRGRGRPTKIIRETIRKDLEVNVLDSNMVSNITL